ncbi:MAG TPA: hypothetical protein VGI19_19090 [Candidatus Cybelea sp.]|jgi:uncharacterized repeat protein (TIGR01451 family)
MRSLTEVFAPGTPTLPERLRTLVVSPERELEPGVTVAATFTFRNYGGAPATGVRIRFNLPDGLVYLVGSGRLNGRELDDETGNSPLLSRAGASVGDVPPNEERRVEIAYSVAGAIENGTTVEMQAAVASFELPPTGSNVVRLIARSRPQLTNALTRIAIEPLADPVPGSCAQVTVRVHNAGESTARDVIVASPIPENTTYVPGSAALNGREIERDLGAPFDRLHAPIILNSLPARASATLVYRVTIANPLPGGAQIVAKADVGSQEAGAFALEPASLTIASAPDLGDDRTTFSAAPLPGVRPGEPVRFTLRAFNAGTATAQRVTAQIELPESLVFVRGATTIDGRPLRERSEESLRFSLGPIEAGAGVTLCADAVLLAPIANGTIVTTIAGVDWEPAAAGGTRRLECSVVARSDPAFTQRRNGLIRKGSASVSPGSEIEALISLENEGSADANDGVLQFRVMPPLEELRVDEAGSGLAIERSSVGSHRDTVELGQLEAYGSRRLTLRARVPSPCADGTEIRIGAGLHTRELGEVRFADASWRVDSHPAFDTRTSRLDLAGDQVLHPNQLAEVDVLVTNIGTDTAHDVRLRSYLSPEARLESVDGAIREKSSLLFGELAAGSSVRARLGLRLLRGLAKDWPVMVDAVLSADGVMPVPLERLTIATSAEPDFSVGVFRSDPAEVVAPGETVEWTLQVRNGGDGTARLVAIAIAGPDSLIYVPNSTTVNDVPIRDAGALPPFAVGQGIILSEVDPGVEAAIRWRTVVHNALAAGSSISHVARVHYDGERDDEIISAELRIRATPIFANAIAGLPFGLDGMLGPALVDRPAALTEDRFLQLPPATPVGEGNGAYSLAQLSPPPDSEGESAQAEFYESTETAETASTTVTLTTFAPERIGRAARFLREARFSGLITHLFAVRAFLPDAIGDAHCGALAATKELLRDEFDRLFIKLRLPGYVVAPRDLETPSLRSTVERLIAEAADARGVPVESPTVAIALRGGFEPGELRELGDRLDSAPLATAPPWSALARLLPSQPPEYAAYRALLVESLDALLDADANDFIDALQHRDDAKLDRALDAVIATLHSLA